MPAKPKSPETKEQVSAQPATEPYAEAEQAVAAAADVKIPDEADDVRVRIPDADKATIELNDFVAKIMEERNKPEPVYVPPAQHPRQVEQTRLEMEAGAKRVAENEVEQGNRPVPVRDPSEGTSTPVYRPVDFVPGMNQGNVSARQV